jgi:hypothetical protein
MILAWTLVYATAGVAQVDIKLGDENGEFLGLMLRIRSQTVFTVGGEVRVNCFLTTSTVLALSMQMRHVQPARIVPASSVSTLTELRKARLFRARLLFTRGGETCVKPYSVFIVRKRCPRSSPRTRILIRRSRTEAFRRHHRDPVVSSRLRRFLLPQPAGRDIEHHVHRAAIWDRVTTFGPPGISSASVAAAETVLQSPPKLRLPASANRAVSSETLTRCGGMREVYP